jgi:PAS domain S-box-containing protein
MTPISTLDPAACIDWEDAAVREHLSRLAQVAQGTESIVIVTDVAGVIVWVNDSFTRTTGYTLEESVGQVPGELLQGPDTDPEEKARIGAALRARKSVAAELVNYTKEGRKYWIGMKIQPLRNAAGAIDGFMAIQADITERREQRLERELMTTRFNLVTRAAHVGIFERAVGEERVWWNPVMYEIAGQNPATFRPTVASWLELVHPDDRERVRVIAESESRTRASPSVEHRIVRPDGSICHVEAIACVERSTSTRIVVIVVDVTTRVESDMRQRALQQQVYDNSHHARMAEFATGVLHNVSNVINSLGVANTTARRGLKALRLDRLEQTSALISSNRARLDTFLTEDERGRHLPDYLPALSTQLASEIKTVRAELDAIDALLHHLRHIISTQQAQAKLGGLREPLSLREIIESALLANALERVGIEIVRDYEEMPPVVTDRHKLLQILVNLISNGCDAVQACATPHKRIAVRLYREAENAVISVEDSGIGMSEDVLARLWRFGYTTKRNGHGFGLHNSANAAREIGASLEAHSEGAGKGSRFTIKLPLDGDSELFQGVAA